MPLSAFILQGIPEQIALVTLAFVITQSPIKWKTVCFSGTFLALTAYAIRTFVRPFGIHTLVIMVLLFLILLKIGKVEITKSIIASLLSMVLLIFSEMVCVSSLMAVFHITDKMLATDTTIRILISLPQVVLLFLTAFILTKVLTRGGLNVHRNQ